MSNDAEHSRLAVIEAIAGLRSMVESFDRGMAEHRTDMKAELGALRDIDRRLTSMETKMDHMTGELHATRSKVEALEAENNRRAGERSFVGIVLQTPIMGWFVAGTIAVIGWVRGWFVG
jgi:hypothetical protein